MNNSKPLLSICCITYNHEDYIRDAIEGFLSQKTTFPIEILIHDDASTDNTAEIITEYQQKYPDIIKPILQKENQYSKGITGMNSRFNISRAEGKYVAFCEGDDYWTDSNKLHKQVDFMEKNTEYGLTHSDFDEFIQDRKILLPDRNKRLGKNSPQVAGNVFENQLYFDKYHVRTVTACIRKDLAVEATKSIKQLMDQGVPLGDYPLFLELSKQTKFKYFDESMAVHRILTESASHTKDAEKKANFLRAGAAIQDFFIKRYPISKELHEKIIRKRIEIFLKVSIRINNRQLVEDVSKYKEYWTLKNKLYSFISRKNHRVSCYNNIYRSLPAKAIRYICRKINRK